MFLPAQQKKKYTVGKTLRQMKKLRRQDPQAHVAQMPPELKLYVDELVSKGLKVKGLAFGEFTTKNGLPYPGLIAVEKIATNTILVRVPVDCLLSTRVAFNSEIEKMFRQNPQYFAKRFTSDWEDHILLAYLLYEYQRGTKSDWYNLIRNLPREIDYAIFWDEKEITMLQDEYMKLGIDNERKKFSQQCEEFIKIARKYPGFFRKETLTEENIRWIHTHLVTRCFGKYFEYTTMVPFAELFNHECTDVYYTMSYNKGNPHDQHEQFYEQKELTEEEIAQLDTTDGTYDADDYYGLDEDVNLDRILKRSTPLQPTVQNPNASEDILKDVRACKSYLVSFVSFNDTVSLSYLCQIFAQLAQVLLMESVAQQRAALQNIHALNVKYLAAVKGFYSRLGKTTYSYGVRQKKNSLKQEVEADQLKPNEEYFLKDWPKDKFDEFLMLCSTKDQFEKNAQVYFCYGRLPNKLLLMRYGIALQHNKYDHLFIRINAEEEFLANPVYRGILEVLPQIEMNKFRRFKVKRTKFCCELVTYFRSKHWLYKDKEPVDFIFYVIDLKREIQVLNETMTLLQQQLSGRYSKSLEANEKMLFDKSFNYHQHFSLIYRIQQQRILHEQIKMVEYALQTVTQLLKTDSTIKEVLPQEPDRQNWTRQIMMTKYFQSFR